MTNPVPISNFQLSPVQMIYINMNREICSIAMANNTAGFGTNARDWPNITDVIVPMFAAPREKFYPIGFTFHTYSIHRHFFTTIGDSMQNAALAIYQERLKMSGTNLAPHETLLTPEEALFCANGVANYDSIKDKDFRLENTSLTVWLRFPSEGGVVA